MYRTEVPVREFHLFLRLKSIYFSERTTFSPFKMYPLPHSTFLNKYDSTLNRKKCMRSNLDCSNLHCTFHANLALTSRSPRRTSSAAGSASQLCTAYYINSVSWHCLCWLFWLSGGGHEKLIRRLQAQKKENKGSWLAGWTLCAGWKKDNLPSGQ